MARIASLRRCRARPSTGSFFPLPTRHGYVLRRSAPPAASMIAATAAWITAFRSTASRIIGLRRNGAQQTWCNSVAGFPGFSLPSCALHQVGVSAPRHVTPNSSGCFVTPTRTTALPIGERAWPDAGSIGDDKRIGRTYLDGTGIARAIEDTGHKMPRLRSRRCRSPTNSRASISPSSGPTWQPDAPLAARLATWGFWMRSVVRVNMRSTKTAWLCLCQG